MSLGFEVIKAGTGAVPPAGSKVSVHYTGTLTDGKMFDSSRTRGKEFTFTLGAGQVIKAWDQGVAKMKVGDQVKLTCPPSLAYGKQGIRNVIPPNATLIFDVELISFKQ